MSVATPQIPVRGFHCLKSGFESLIFYLMLCHRSRHPYCVPSSATAVTFPDCAPSSATAVIFPDCATAVFINDRSFPNCTAASTTIHMFPDYTPASVTLRPFPECNTALFNDRLFPVSFHLPSPVDNILILLQFLLPVTHILKPHVIFRRDFTSRK